MNQEELTKIKYNDLIKDQQNQYIIGCDEVGYGALCGPVVVCGVKARGGDDILEGINDSKKLSGKKREKLKEKLLELVDDGKIEFYISERDNNQIDEFGLGAMLKDAYIEIFNKLYCNNSLIICDGNLKFDIEMNKISLIKADAVVPSVMSASILAKTYRDEKMRGYHLEYPNYGWDKNVGYGTEFHMKAIEKYGYSPLHRTSCELRSVYNTDGF